MRAALRTVSLVLVLLFLYIPLMQTGSAAPVPQPVTGVMLMPPAVHLFGHVTLINYYAPSGSCYAVVELQDLPRKSVVVRSYEQRLQSMLETALLSGNLISFVGQSFLVQSPPRGGTWNMDVYTIDEITLYSIK